MDRYEGKVRVFQRLRCQWVVSVSLQLESVRLLSVVVAVVAQWADL